MESLYIPTKPSSLPAEQRWLVLAPHPDDEVFGCGGLVALGQAAGRDIQVVVATDGAGYEPAAQSRLEVLHTRSQESLAAGRVLGLGPEQYAFWGLHDRGLNQMPEGELSSRIEAQARQCSAELMLVPSLWEVHPDHLALTRAAWQALAALPECTVMFFEIAGALQPNRLFDVTSVWTQKAHAMGCFLSQQAMRDYCGHVEALNRYRSYPLENTASHAEAYWYLDVADVKRMHHEGLTPIPHTQGKDMALVRQAERELGKMAEQRAHREAQLQAQIKKLDDDVRQALSESAVQLAQKDAEIAKLAKDVEQALSESAVQLAQKDAEIAKLAKDVEQVLKESLDQVQLKDAEIAKLTGDVHSLQEALLAAEQQRKMVQSALDALRRTRLGQLSVRLRRWLSKV